MHLPAASQPGPQLSSCLGCPTEAWAAALPVGCSYRTTLEPMNPAHACMSHGNGTAALILMRYLYTIAQAAGGAGHRGEGQDPAGAGALLGQGRLGERAGAGPGQSLQRLPDACMLGWEWRQLLLPESKMGAAFDVSAVEPWQATRALSGICQACLLPPHGIVLHACHPDIAPFCALYRTGLPVLRRLRVLWQAFWSLRQLRARGGSARAPAILMPAASHARACDRPLMPAPGALAWLGDQGWPCMAKLLHAPMRP